VIDQHFVDSQSGKVKGSSHEDSRSANSRKDQSH
jgi:hypothetical protein